MVENVFFQSHCLSLPTGQYRDQRIILWIYVKTIQKIILYNMINGPLRMYYTYIISEGIKSI